MTMFVAHTVHGVTTIPGTDPDGLPAVVVVFDITVSGQPRQVGYALQGGLIRSVAEALTECLEHATDQAIAEAGLDVD